MASNKKMASIDFFVGMAFEDYTLWYRDLDVGTLMLGDDNTNLYRFGGFTSSVENAEKIRDFYARSFHIPTEQLKIYKRIIEKVNTEG